MEKRRLVRLAILSSACCIYIAVQLGSPVQVVLKLVFLFALPMAVLNIFVQRLYRRMRKAILPVAVITMALAYSSVIILALLDAEWILKKPGSGGESMLYFATHEGIWLPEIFFVSVVLTLCVRSISRKFGPKVFRRWMLGYYHQPRKETRIFMFLDMRDSTALAEQMGDAKFAELLSEFMSDLSGVVAASGGEVSHYIGDEAVITWLPKQGLKDANCVRMFFDLQTLLESSRDIYIKKFGHCPGFKAGLHFGDVIATEVGDIKSEIVYLGDVMNTTARIQGMCKSLGADLLVSGTLYAQLPKMNSLIFEHAGSVELKGKSEPVELYSCKLP